MNPVTPELRSELLRRNTDPVRLARRVGRHPEQIHELLDGLAAELPAIKFGSARVLRYLSHAEPELLYPEIDRFIDWLELDDRFLACDMRLILANLAPVDLDRRLESGLDRYFAPLLGPVLMVAATVVKGGTAIALARPELAEDIVRRLIGVARGHFRTPECRNLLLGHCIQALDSLLAEVANPAVILRWVRRHRDNPRPATREQAQRLLTHWQ